jgi:uncharacterized protein
MSNARLSRAGRLAAVLLSVLFAGAALGEDHHSLWVVSGKHNTVYLFGSIHLLRGSESLPEVVDDAYRNVDKLVMEIDLDDLDPVAAQQLTLQLGMLPAGKTLAGELGPEASAKVAADTQKLGIPLTMLSQFKPWLAAITLTQLHLLKLGLEPQSGVEQRFVAKAAADHKEILGLETLSDQLGLLANLSPKLQTEFLLQSIEEADETEQEVDGLIAAWRTGDAVALEKYLARGIKEFPELYRPLTTDRNRRWLKRFEELLNADQNYLVIVGALHLVGKDGMIDLLEHKGYAVQQK